MVAERGDTDVASAINVDNQKSSAFDPADEDAGFEKYSVLVLTAAYTQCRHIRK
jgi:hypothetical protein